jgi:hypothetical protein
MAPVVRPDGMGVSNSFPRRRVQGTLRTGSGSVCENIGSTAVDAGGGFLFYPAFGASGDRPCFQHVRVFGPYGTDRKTAKDWQDRHRKRVVTGRVNSIISSCSEFPVGTMGRQAGALATLCSRHSVGVADDPLGVPSVNRRTQDGRTYDFQVHCPSRKANVKSEWPAAIDTYCWPSTS